MKKLSTRKLVFKAEVIGRLSGLGKVHGGVDTTNYTTSEVPETYTGDQCTFGKSGCSAVSNDPESPPSSIV